MTQSSDTSLVTDLRNPEIPYPRSWIDRLIQWINRIPGTTWLFYVALFFTGAFLNNAVRWLDGSLEMGSFIPLRFFDAGYLVIPLALYHHLKLVAGRSFQVFRPVLDASDTELQALEYRITNLPRRLGWLAALLGFVMAVVGLQTDPDAFGLDVSRAFPLALFLYPFTIFSFSTMFALMIQTVRQLRLVNDLHRQATEINLFQLDPVHAFATLTARTGIGLVIFIIFSGLQESSNITEGNLIALFVAGILAIIVFTMPLLGMQNRLKVEKAHLLSGTNESIQVTIDRIHNLVNSNEYEDIGGLNTALSALIVERELISGISTMPWDPSTLRGFASTLLLPIFLWLVTRLLERYI
jgi:hypothetical protein